MAIVFSRLARGDSTAAKVRRRLSSSGGRPQAGARPAGFQAAIDAPVLQEFTRSRLAL